MFGFGPKQAPDLVPFTDARPQIFCTLLCDGVTALRLSSFADLLALHAQLQAERPQLRVLASLDDLGQAAYTSGHAALASDLDDIADDDLPLLAPSSLEDGDYIGSLTSPAEFPIRLANLRRQARDVDFADMAGLLDWSTSGDDNDPVTSNRDPDRALWIGEEKQILFQFVPVASAADTIAAFPNGYFQPDLDPMQNHALARHLDSRHGLALVAIGSRFLAFRRAQPLGFNEADALAADIAALYAGSPPNAAAQLAALLTGRDWLLLRYTES